MVRNLKDQKSFLPSREWCFCASLLPPPSSLQLSSRYKMTIIEIDVTNKNKFRIQYCDLLNVCITAANRIVNEYADAPLPARCRNPHITPGQPVRCENSVRPACHRQHPHRSNQPPLDAPTCPWLDRYAGVQLRTSCAAPRNIINRRTISSARHIPAATSAILETPAAGGHDR